MVYSGLLVGGAIIILNNMKVNGKDYPIYEMENTNHPTRYFNQHKQWQMGTEPWTTAISGDWMATIYGVLAGVFFWGKLDDIIDIMANLGLQQVSDQPVRSIMFSTFTYPPSKKHETSCINVPEIPNWSFLQFRSFPCLWQLCIKRERPTPWKLVLKRWNR